VLVHLIGPESEANGEVYSAANDREQAAIVFKAAARMIAANPSLAKHLDVIKSTKTIVVMTGNLKSAGSVYRALSAEAGTKHGLSPSFIVFDELAQAKSRELFDTLTTSQGARAEPMFLTISTQNNDPTHVLSEMIDDGLKGTDPSVVCHLYAGDDECDLLDEAQWRKANPALGDFRSYDDLKVLAERAVRLPSEEQAFRLLYLNQRVSLHASLIAQQDWKACQSDYTVAPGEPVYLGLDMSITTDLTALVMVSATSGSRVASWFWKPFDLVEDHTKRDRFRYDVAVRKGQLETSPGRIINPRQVAHKIADLCATYDVRGLAYDRYRTRELFSYFTDIELAHQTGPGAGLRLEPIAQTPAGFSPSLNAFEHAVLTDDPGQKLMHDGHPILTFCTMNALARSDPAGNRSLDKDKSRFRIDGAVALAMALGLKALDIQAAPAVNPFEDPSFSLSALMS
jgi:phage terminase large subunit-like protein